MLSTPALFEIFGIAHFSNWRDDLKPNEPLAVAYGNADAAKNTCSLRLGQRGLWLPPGATSWVATLLMVAEWVLGAVLVYGISTAYQRRSS